MERFHDCGTLKNISIDFVIEWPRILTLQSKREKKRKVVDKRKKKSKYIQRERERMLENISTFLLSKLQKST